MRYALLVTAASFAITIVGCSTATTEPTAQVVNTHCPIMGHEVSPDGGTAEWDGKTIGFCCEGCAPKWEKLSEDEKATKLADAGKDHAAH